MTAATDMPAQPLSCRRTCRRVVGRAVKETVPDDPKPAAIGLICHNYGCRHFLVVDTLPKPGGRIMRLRECRHCGRRIVTWEK